MERGWLAATSWAPAGAGDAENTALTSVPRRLGSWGRELAFLFVSTDQRSRAGQGLREHLTLSYRREN